jgi:hypothetical protein
MGIDDASKILENNSAMADEGDRCTECGCLLSSKEGSAYRVHWCNNTDCKNYNITIRRSPL